MEQHIADKEKGFETCETKEYLIVYRFLWVSENAFFPWNKETKSAQKKEKKKETGMDWTADNLKLMEFFFFKRKRKKGEKKREII